MTAPEVVDRAAERAPCRAVGPEPGRRCLDAHRAGVLLVWFALARRTSSAVSRRRLPAHPGRGLVVLVAVLLVLPAAGASGRGGRRRRSLLGAARRW